MKFIMMQTRKLPELLQIVLNISLFLMAIVLSVLLMKETWSIFSSVFLSSEEIDSYFAFTDELLVFFLYFEFIALIVKYFKSNFHFPLRYFIYIGITAIVRLIIVDHEEALSTFWWSMAILVLIGSLFLANTRVVRKDH
ncbi:phosphate-starvation-inducible protein PsiE [Paenibacillus bovis]|uniref:Protein PsiE homolog n=1 Tax=Paenibacillus bovis TaxID=1616788 RepID=A0A172ZNN6_9BACL|nr:phosphate-starvation-inducible protein PsiE [Paenibacillus bovis]ANF98830.1 phosphate-starvation-inducible protein PsiE [Paenibacillus bovis]